MAADQSHTLLARLDGFLKAFEWLNCKTNHGCSFFVCEMPKAGGVADAVADYFKLHASHFRVEPVAEIGRELEEVFGRFLFLFQDPHGDHLVDPRRSFTLMEDAGRQSVLEELAGMLQALEVTAAWRVRPSLECEEMREWCFQDDIALEFPAGMCLIHFGVSD
jgi:hypothetical protein